MDKLKRKKQLQVYILNTALRSALQGAKNTHPDEFIALFRGEYQPDASGKPEDISERKSNPKLLRLPIDSGAQHFRRAIFAPGYKPEKSRNKDGKPDPLKTLVLTELIIPPFAHGDEESSSYSPYFIPANTSEKASFHSHPDFDSAYPSDEDIRYFSLSGGVHFIACHPFRLQDVACFDSQGNPLPFRIVARKADRDVLSDSVHNSCRRKIS